MEIKDYIKQCNMKIVQIIFFFFCFIAARAQSSFSYDTAFTVAPYNFILGTNTIGGKYQFTGASKLLEQAKQVRAMGSNILKISLGQNSPKQYGLNIDEKPQTTLALFRSSPDYKQVFDMDFTYIFCWVHTITGIEWKKGIDKEQEKILYYEMYEFASYLLKEYKNSGKTFIIGNWEGDWLLHPNYNRNISPTDEHIQNMTKWFQIRQKAIDDAKKKWKAENVQLYHYIEVNLVLKGLKGENCIAKSILPFVDADLVSYSSYEAIKNRTYQEKKQELTRIFDYLEGQLKPKASMPFSRRVFIGEYGYHASIRNPESFRKQFDETREIMKISIELNLPFALHWQMYNNEYEADGTSKQMSLVNEQGEKMPLYHLHRYFYREMNNYLNAYRQEKKTYPARDAFSKKALTVLDAYTY